MFNFYVHLHRPPSFSSAVACALSWSFLMTHWYIPLSSFLTDSILRIASVWFMNFPSFIHLIVLIGFPEKWHVKIAGRPKSIVWTVGSMEADRGAVTVKTVSTLSPPTELLTTQRYFPESSTIAFLIMRVPETCLMRSPSGTGDLRSDPSMNLYHLVGLEKLMLVFENILARKKNGFATKWEGIRMEPA